MVDKEVVRFAITLDVFSKAKPASDLRLPFEIEPVVEEYLAAGGGTADEGSAVVSGGCAAVVVVYGKVVSRSDGSELPADISVIEPRSGGLGEVEGGRYWSNKCVVKIDEGFERGKKKIRYRGGMGI